MMKFSEALEQLQEGKVLRRALWPMEQTLYMEKGSMDGGDLEALRMADHDFGGVLHTFFEAGDDGTTTRLPCLVNSNHTGKMLGWAPNQQDMFALDWEIA